MDKDLRDPEKIGEWLDSPVNPRAEKSVLERADLLPQIDIPDFSGSDSLGAETIKEYRQELEEREDIYAKSALDSLDKHGKVVGFEPEID